MAAPKTKPTDFQAQFQGLFDKNKRMSAGIPVASAGVYTANQYPLMGVQNMNVTWASPSVGSIRYTANNISTGGG